MKFTITIPVSPDQEDIIFDHVFYGKELLVRADEKAWVYGKLRRIHPQASLTETFLDITNCTWRLTGDDGMPEVSNAA